MYKKIIISIMLIIISCLIFSSCNIEKGDEFIPGIDPQLTTISKITEETKKEYANFPMRILNPTRILPNLSLNTLKSDKCIKNKIQSDYNYFFDSTRTRAIPTYTIYTKEMTDAYYNAMYKDIEINGAFTSLYDNYESLDYELEGFSFHISIRKNDATILYSIPPERLSTTHLMDLNNDYLGCDRYMEDFVEDTYMPSINNNVLKWCKYQAEGIYKGLRYKTYTTISPSDITPTYHLITIKNTILVEETIEGYRMGYTITYNVSDFSLVRIYTSKENAIPKSMDPILTPLKEKTIDMAKAFIDSSLDYKQK